MDILQLATALDGIPVHILFLIGLIVLYRENRALHEKLEQVKMGQLATRDMLTDQNTQIAQIKTLVVPQTVKVSYPPEKRS